MIEPELWIPVLTFALLTACALAWGLVRVAWTAGCVLVAGFVIEALLEDAYRALVLLVRFGAPVFLFVGVALVVGRRGARSLSWWRCVLAVALFAGVPAYYCGVDARVLLLALPILVALAVDALGRELGRAARG